MARHFQGIANRIGQGHSDYVLTRVEHAAGVSPAGARQLRAGEMVTDAGDRAALARALEQQLSLTGPARQVLIALLLPAVQKVPAAAGRTPRESTKDPDETITIHGGPTVLLQSLGVSAVGASQFLRGQPVTGTGDRGVLAHVARILLGDAR